MQKSYGKEKTIYTKKNKCSLYYINGNSFFLCYKFVYACIYEQLIAIHSVSAALRYPIPIPPKDSNHTRSIIFRYAFHALILLLKVRRESRECSHAAQFKLVELCDK